MRHVLAMHLTNGSRRVAVGSLLVLVTVAQRAPAQPTAAQDGGRRGVADIQQPSTPVPSTRLPSASAEPPAAERSGALLGVAALGNTTGGGVELDARYRWGAGPQLGLLVNGHAASHAYFGGTKAEGVASGAVKLVALVPIVTAQSIEFDVRLMTGFEYARDVVGQVTPHRDALRSVTELAWLAHVPIGTASVLRAGAILTFELETKPTRGLADQALLLSVGFGRQIAEGALLYASVDAGGTYGFDGDNGKVITRGALGARWSWGGASAAVF